MTYIFDSLLKIGDRFENKTGDKLTLTRINHDKPENFVYEFKDEKDNLCYGSLNDILLNLRSI